MRINSPLMLSELSLGMKQQAELLPAEQAELEKLAAHAREVAQECSIYTAARMLSRYERIFNLKTTGRTLQERRDALLAALNARMRITREQMEQLAAGFSKRPAEVREFNSESRFEVVLFPGSSAVNDELLSRELSTYKPAHLQMDIVHETPVMETTYAADAWWLVEEITIREVF